MKLIELYESYNSLKKLGKCKFSNYALSRNIYMLTKRVHEECIFYITEEAKLVDEYALKDDNGKIVYVSETKIQLRNPEFKKIFDEKVNDLRNTEINDLTKINISDSDFINSSDIPSPEEMGILEVVINWL